MKKSDLIKLTFIAVLMSTCTKELPFPEADDSPVIVVNSLFSPEQGMQVHVSESCHIKLKDCSFSDIANAEVHLLDASGAMMSVLNHQGGGMYSSDNYDVEYDKTYQLEVSVGSTLTPVKTKTSVPKTLNTKMIGIAERLIHNRLVWAFDLEIEDDPAEANYYVIEGTFDVAGYPSGQGHDNFESEVNGYIEPHFSHLTDDPNADNNQIAIGTDFIPFVLRAVYLSDKNFNGKTYITSVGVLDEGLRGQSASVANITVKSVSKEMYDYMISLEAHRTSPTDPFSEPQQVYSNIEGGVGIFGGFTQQEFSRELPRSEYAFPSEVFTENDGCTGPCSIKFSTNGGPKLSYFWDFGDGATSTEPIVEHRYEQPGVYLVRSEATSTNGDGSTWNLEVTIK